MNFNLTSTLLDYQEVAVNFALKHRYSLNAFDMGLGKSIIAIAASSRLEGLIVVVCPAFLKFNFEEEYRKHTDVTNIAIVEKPEDLPGALLSQVAIVAYSKIKLAPELFKAASMVIFDEAHYLKNTDIARTVLTIYFLKQSLPPYVLMLTGTPVQNRVVELYSLLGILGLDPSRSNGLRIQDKYKSFGAFANRFSLKQKFKVKVRNRYIDIVKYHGLQNEEELKTYLNGKYTRMLTKDAIKLPDLLEKHVLIKKKSVNDKKLLAYYNEFEGEEKSGSHYASIKRKSALSKTKYTTKYAKNIFEETGTPVVIFSCHVEPVKEIAEGLPNSRFIVGSISNEERRDIVRDFQDGKVDYLVATIGSSSTGLTLTAANNVVFNDYDYVPGNNEQASKRIHRIGQTETCTIHYIFASKVDRQIMETIRDKNKVIKRFD